MADQTAILEIKAEAKQASGEIQRLNAEFVAALGRMATAADKVSLDKAQVEAAELGQRLAEAAAKGTSSLASLESAGVKSTAQITKLGLEVKRASVNLESAAHIVGKFGTEAERAASAAALALNKVSTETDEAISDVSRLNREFEVAVTRMNAAANKVEFDLAQKSATQLGSQLEAATTKATAGLTKLQAGGRATTEQLGKLATEAGRTATTVTAAATATSRFGVAATAAVGGVAALGTSLKAAFLQYTALATAIAAVIGFLKQSVTGAAEQAQADARLAAAIESTGRASEFSLGKLKEFASALQLTTQFTDEAVEEVQAFLLAFGGVGPENIKRATELTLDLAVAMKTDAAGAARLLAKALKNPDEALGAINRTTGAFNQAQRDAITAMVESGDKAGALDAVLGTLDGTVGGLAPKTEAVSSGFGQLKKAAGEAAETLGQAGLADALKRTFDGLSALLGSGGGSKALEFFGRLLGGVVDSINLLVAGLTGSFGVLSGFFGLLTTGVEKSLAVLAKLAEAAHFEQVAATTQAASDAVGGLSDDMLAYSETALRAAKTGVTEAFQGLIGTAKEAKPALDDLTQSFEEGGTAAERQAAAIDDLVAKLRGSRPELEAQTTALLGAVAAIKEEGKVTEETAASIGAQAAALLAGWTKFGEEAPLALRKLAEAFPATVEAGKAAVAQVEALTATYEELQRKAAEGLASPVAELDTGAFDDATAAVADLQAEISGLEAKPILSPDEVVRLAELRDAMPGLIANQNALAQSAIATGDAYTQVSEAQQTLLDSTAALNALIEGGASQEQIAEFLSGGKIGEDAAAAAAGVETLAYETKVLADGTTALITPTQQATTGLQQLADGSFAMVDAADGLPELFDATGKSLGQAGEGATQLAGSMPAAAEGMADLADAAAGSGDPLEKIGELLERLAKNAPAMAAGIKELGAAVKTEVPGIVSGLGDLAGAFGGALSACQSFRTCAGGGGGNGTGETA